MSDLDLWRAALRGRLPATAPDEALALARETWALMDAAVDNRIGRMVGRVVWFTLGCVMGRVLA